MSGLEDEDGIDGPFDRAMARAMRDDMNATERRLESKRILRDPETADNIEVRLGIVRRIQAGEITPEAGKAELVAIKRAARKAGKQVWAR